MSNGECFYAKITKGYKPSLLRKKSKGGKWGELRVGVIFLNRQGGQSY